MKTKILSITFLFVVASFALKAQDYRTAIGLRVGTNNGLTIKHFTKPKVAFEGIVSTRYKALGVTGLVEGHTRFFDVNRLNFVYGAGGHVYIWGENKRYNSPFDRTSVIGVDGILGLEYTFKEIPINMSLDWKPTFNLNANDGFWGDETGFSIRYTF